MGKYRFKNVTERLYNWLNPWGPHKFGTYAPLSLSWFHEKLIKFYFWSNRQRAIRYIPVLKVLNNSVDLETPILEIGSGCLGIAPYTSHRVIGLDKNTAGPRLPNMTLVNGDAINLPFRDNSFDLVCSLDMLEHLPSSNRQDAILEICRVARKIAIISVPCGSETEMWEEKARKHYSNLIKKNKLCKWKTEFLIKHNQYLFEHLEYGIPEIDDILKYLKSCEHKTKTPLSVHVTGNESRYVWYMGALGYMNFGYFRSTMTTLLFTLLFPIISRISLGGYYRHVFIVDKRSNPLSPR